MSETTPPVFNGEEHVFGDEVRVHALFEIRAVLAEQVLVARLLDEVGIHGARADGGGGDLAFQILANGLAERQHGMLGRTVDTAEGEDIPGGD